MLQQREIEEATVELDPNWRQQAEQYAAWYVAALAGKTKFQVDNESLETLAMAISNYKGFHDKDKSNRSKPISDVLLRMLEDLFKRLNMTEVDVPQQYKFCGVEDATSTKNFTSIDAKTGVTYCYKALTIIRAILISEKQYNSKKLDTSEFVKTLLSTLSTIFTDKATKFKSFSSVDVGSEKKKLDLIEKLVSNIDKELKWYAHYLKLGEDQQLAAKSVEGLVNYIITKVAETGIDKLLQKSEKVPHAQKVLQHYFNAQTADEYVMLFQEINKGIKLSRAEGKNEKKSRGLEFALAFLRDWLLYAIVINENSEVKFNYKQMWSIYESISYIEFKSISLSVKDADVAPATLHVLDQLKQLQLKKPLEQKPPDQNYIQQIKRLTINLPNKVNGGDLDKGEYCYKCGSYWAVTMTSLLNDCEAEEKTRKEVSVYALIWNMRIVDYYKRNQKTLDADLDFGPYYLIGLNLLTACDKIETHESLPQEFKKNFAERVLEVQSLGANLDEKQRQKELQEYREQNKSKSKEAATSTQSKLITSQSSVYSTPQANIPQPMNSMEPPASQNESPTPQ